MFARDIPGFLPGFVGGLLFFRRHGRFLLIFPVTSSLFRHNVSLNSGQMIFSGQLLPYPDGCAGVWSELPDPSRQSALTLFLSVRAVTFPIISGRIKVSVLRYIYRDTGIFDRLIPAIASPSGAVRRVHQVSVQRDLDGNAGPIGRPIPVIACPARSI